MITPSCRVCPGFDSPWAHITIPLFFQLHWSVQKHLADHEFILNVKFRPHDGLLVGKRPMRVIQIPIQLHTSNIGIYIIRNFSQLFRFLLGAHHFPLRKHLADYEFIPNVKFRPHDSCCCLSFRAPFSYTHRIFEALLFGTFLNGFRQPLGSLETAHQQSHAIRHWSGEKANFVFWRILRTTDELKYTQVEMRAVWVFKDAGSTCRNLIAPIIQKTHRVEYELRPKKS